MTRSNNQEPSHVEVHEALEGSLREFFAGHVLAEVLIDSARVHEVLQRFSVLEIGPGPVGPYWVYVSSGAWEVVDANGAHIEFYIIAPERNERHLELLSILAYYHASDLGPLGLGHTLPIGEPWLAGSTCDHFLISPPYVPTGYFETVEVRGLHIHLLWALPITKAERDFKMQHGREALEQRFEQTGMAYWQPTRASVV